MNLTVFGFTKENGSCSKSFGFMDFNQIWRRSPMISNYSHQRWWALFSKAHTETPLIPKSSRKSLRPSQLAALACMNLRCSSTNHLEPYLCRSFACSATYSCLRRITLPSFSASKCCMTASQC